MNSATYIPTGIASFDPPAEIDTLKFGERTADVRAWIYAKPGAEGRDFAPGKIQPHSSSSTRSWTK